MKGLYLKLAKAIANMNSQYRDTDVQNENKIKNSLFSNQTFPHDKNMRIQ